MDFKIEEVKKNKEVTIDSLSMAVDQMSKTLSAFLGFIKLNEIG